MLISHKLTEYAHGDNPHCQVLDPCDQQQLQNMVLEKSLQDPLKV